MNQTVVSSELGSQRDPELAVNVASETELPVTSLPDVTSQSVSLKQTQNCLANQPKQEETHGTPDGRTEDSALISSSSISSLVCCDYADSSDASDDHTWQDTEIVESVGYRLSNASMVSGFNDAIKQQLSQRMKVHRANQDFFALNKEIWFLLQFSPFLKTKQSKIKAEKYSSVSDPFTSASNLYYDSTTHDAKSVGYFCKSSNL